LDVDNLLLQAGDFLIGGLLIGVAGITYLYDRVLHTDREILQDEWITLAFLIYSGFSIVFFTQASQARRTAVALLAVTSPALVYSLYQIERRWNDIGRIVIVVLLVSGTFFGIARPGVYKIERTSGFVPALYGPDIAAVDHFSTYSVETNAGPAGYTDGYTSLSAYFERVEDGYDTGRYEYSTERLTDVRMLQTNQSHIEQLLTGDSSPVFIYRTYYEGFAGVKPPPEANVIYSSGETKILS
jgi:hypothetical protein